MGLDTTKSARFSRALSSRLFRTKPASVTSKSNGFISNIPYVNKFAKNKPDNNDATRTITVQSVERTVVAFGNGNDIEEISIPEKEIVFGQKFRPKKERRKFAVDKFQEETVDSRFKILKNDRAFSPSRISEIVNEESPAAVLDVTADVHNTNQECLNPLDIDKEIHPSNPFMIHQRSSIRQILEPLRPNAVNKFNTGPLPTPLRTPTTNPRSHPKQLRNELVNRLNDIHGKDPANDDIFFVLPNQKEYVGVSGSPLEVEDLRKLPKISRKSNMDGNFKNLQLVDIPLHSKLTSLSRKKSALTKEKNLNILSSLDVIEATTGMIPIEDLECWMSRLPPALQQVPLNHLVIPGKTLIIFLMLF